MGANHEETPLKNLEGFTEESSEFYRQNFATIFRKRDGTAAPFLCRGGTKKHLLTPTKRGYIIIQLNWNIKEG